MGNRLNNTLTQSSREVNQLRKSFNNLNQRLDALLVQLGGGKRRAVEVRGSNDVFGEKRVVDRAKQRYEKIQKELEQLEGSASKYKLRKKKLERDNANNDILVAKEALNNAALQLVRKKGLNRLGKAATLGGLGIGIFNAYNSKGNSTPEEKAKEETPKSKYRWTPNNGWEEYENGKWSPQQQEFGVDRYGNVNYYDGQDWVSDYIQSSDGTIYNKQGDVLGYAIDPLIMHSAGYDNIFDYNAAKALGKKATPEEIAQVQQKLGVTPDGKWGAKTQAAFEKAISKIADLYDPSSLQSIYQRKQETGW